MYLMVLLKRFSECVAMPDHSNWLLQFGSLKAAQKLVSLFLVRVCAHVSGLVGMVMSELLCKAQKCLKKILLRKRN